MARKEPFPGYNWLSKFVTKGREAQVRPILSQIYIPETNSIAAACDGDVMAVVYIGDDVPRGYMPPKGKPKIDDPGHYPDPIQVAFFDVTHWIEVNTADLVRAIKSAKAFADNVFIDFSPDDNRLGILASNPEDGAIGTSLKASLVEGDFDPRFRGEFSASNLIKILSGWTDEMTEIGIKAVPATPMNSFSDRSHRQPVRLQPQRKGNSPLAVLMSTDLDGIQTNGYLADLQALRLPEPMERIQLKKTPRKRRKARSVPFQGLDNPLTVPEALDADFVALRANLEADGWTLERRCAVGEWKWKITPRLKAKDKKLEPSGGIREYEMAIRKAAINAGIKRTPRQRILAERTVAGMKLVMKRKRPFGQFVPGWEVKAPTDEERQKYAQNYERCIHQISVHLSNALNSELNRTWAYYYLDSEIEQANKNADHANEWAQWAA